jgi:hypothetical protein
MNRPAASSELLIAIVGVGLTLMALGLPLGVVDLSREASLTVVIVGGLLVTPILVFPTRLAQWWTGGRRRRAGKDGGGPDPSLTAAECRRVSRAIGELVDSATTEPALGVAGLLTRAGTRSQAREREAVAAYQRDFREWAQRVFQDAAALGAVSTSAQSPVEGRSFTQLALLPEIFASAAGHLDGAR